jgi:hypothetical protein
VAVNATQALASWMQMQTAFTLFGTRNGEQTLTSSRATPTWWPSTTKSP